MNDSLILTKVTQTKLIMVSNVDHQFFSRLLLSLQLDTSIEIKGSRMLLK